MQGKAVTLKCESSDNPPPVKYKIIKVGAAGEIKSFEQGTGMQARVLTSAMSSAEEGEYKCVVQNAGGTPSQESEALRLTLKSKLSCVCLFNNFFNLTFLSYSSALCRC